VNVDYCSRRLYPSALSGEARQRFDGADDLTGGDELFGATLEDSVEDDPQVFTASREETQGIEVAMKSAIVYVIAAGNVCRAEPISVVLFDLFAIRVATDGAFSGVALDVRRKFFVFIERLFRARD